MKLKYLVLSTLFTCSVVFGNGRSNLAKIVSGRVRKVVLKAPFGYSHVYPIYNYKLTRLQKMAVSKIALNKKKAFNKYAEYDTEEQLNKSAALRNLPGRIHLLVGCHIYYKFRGQGYIEKCYKNGWYLCEDTEHGRPLLDLKPNNIRAFLDVPDPLGSGLIK